MKIRIGVLLAIAFSVGLAIAVGVKVALQVPYSPSSPSAPTLEAVAPSPQIVAQTGDRLPEIRAEAIVPERLVRDLKTLAFDRSTPESRDRARRYIVEQLQAAGWSPTPHPFPGGINIVAERSGTDPDAGTVLVAAHYDTVPGSPGADDNASGVAVALEVARLLGAVPTPRSLQLAFFDLEETGLQGSLAFAGEADPQRLHGAIVMDMVAFACHEPGCQDYPKGLPVKAPDRGNFLAIVGDLEHLPLIEAFQQATRDPLPAIFTLPVPFKGLSIPDTLRSDHAPFWYRGIGAVLVTDTANLRSPHYHQPSDTPSNIDRDFFLGAAQLVVNATTIVLNRRASLDSPLPSRPTATGRSLQESAGSLF